ncbi:flavodoxin family protein [Geomonas sp. RF6]|uniref:flavodoxin family protein n=1 Tax=Geomonas sp. RF6 TaxID=2897342 RepID=UPI001E58D1BC|nr:flavodoxin family protein [Geomonas sp. RF6]UFS68805.1 flavodoxin family protein [Geomonas sp. RF6]
MKIVALLGSPRSNSNSSAIANRFTETAAARGAQVQTFEINRLTYHGCQGCYACKRGFEHCVVKDDLAEVLKAVEGADVVVLASPVYYGDVTSQMKAYIDRNYSFLKPDYITNPQPSRLSPKKLLFILTQGNPDQAMFGDIFGRYDFFMKWMGFTESRLIRLCGVGPASADAVPAECLAEAEEAAKALVIE